MDALEPTVPAELRTKGLSACWLKYLACAAMLIDHTDAVFHLLGGVAGPQSLLFYLLRYVGRIAFPIFAFFVAEGCRRTHDLADYAKRLFLFALVSQLPFTLALFSRRGVIDLWGGSVILTFFLAVAGVCLYRSAREYVPAPVAFLPVLAMAVLASALRTDYSWKGVLIVFFLSLCKTKKKQLLCLGLCMVGIYLLIPVGIVYLPALLYLVRGMDPQQLWRNIADGFHLWFPFQLPFALLQTVFACAALIPLAFYQGQRGRGGKWFFYLFYPAHLSALFVLRLLTD